MTNSGNLPDNFTFPFVLKACSRLFDLKMGFQFHSQVIRLGLFMDIYIGSSLVYLYTSCGEIGLARIVFEGIEIKNVVTWNVMISGCVRNGKFVKEALKYFQEMRVECAEDMFDEFSLVSVSSACANMGTLVLGKWVHGLVFKTGFCEVVPLGNALVDMYGKCGNLDDACKVFEQMCVRDIVSWSTMIDVLGMHGFGRRAIEVFIQMERAGIVPDDTAFTSLLCACSHAGLLHEGREWFKRLSCDYGFTPKIQHYGCMVDLLGKAGQLKEAYELITEMPVQPDAATWRSMFGACLYHGDFNLAKIAASKLMLFDLDDSGDTVILSNLYSKLRRWDDVERIRRGTMKYPGKVDDHTSCPPCECDCSSSDNILSSSLGLMNSSLADCGKHDPEMNQELEKDMIDLLKEEISLQRNVTNDNIEHTKASILEARKTSSQYQKEDEKCTAGMETCEEAREKAEAELRAERKQSELWESRAREHGWRDLRRTSL
ncbi:Pentatricopeptide repeat-containing protein [Thalictrum thalictroides]|uniref:Pentatricopeptide repeat-containing protein n=1 Tax=Thalictrum thalictroides TaxID=46969 RepID=A0A7J6XBC3_THATH|nr:Pentatricopeptide repeat-containing protein [Thalictrum thalictroides]